MDLGSTLPVSRRLFSQRLIEGKEISKIVATSWRGIARSIASTTFSLRSFEKLSCDTVSLRINRRASRCQISG
jgi:hypothetical protein